MSSESLPEPADEVTELPQQSIKPRSTRRKSSSASNEPEDAKGAGAAGVGGGSTLVLLVSLLPDGPLKTVLFLLAPSVTILCSALWIWGYHKILERSAIKDMEASYAAAKQAIEEALKNPTLTKEQRAAFEQKRLENDQIMVEFRMARVSRHAPKK